MTQAMRVIAKNIALGKTKIRLNTSDSSYALTNASGLGCSNGVFSVTGWVASVALVEAVVDAEGSGIERREGMM